MDKCCAYLDELGIEYELIEHEAVYTVEEAMAVLPGRIEIKNLFIQNDKGSQRYLVLMPGLKKLDLKSLAIKLSEKKLRFVNPARLEDILGVKPGSVSLFCCLRKESEDVTLVIDDELLKETELGFHPIVNTATLFLDQKSFAKVLDNLPHNKKIIAV